MIEKNKDKLTFGLALKVALALLLAMILIQLLGCVKPIILPSSKTIRTLKVGDQLQFELCIDGKCDEALPLDTDQLKCIYPAYLDEMLDDIAYCKEKLLSK